MWRGNKRRGEGRGRKEYIPQTHRDSKGPLGLLTIPMHPLTHRRSTALGDIPRRARLRMLRITHIGRGLRVDTDGVQGGEDGVHDEAEERQPAVADEHDDFADGDEHGEDGDDDVEIRDAVFF